MTSHEGTEAVARLASRRQFTVEMALAMLGGAVITIGCGGGGGGRPSAPTTPAPSPTPTDGKVASIATNHGHVAQITNAQLQSGNRLMLEIQGTAFHSHTLELTADEIARIRGGERVSKDSSGGTAGPPPHTHEVIFN